MAIVSNFIRRILGPMSFPRYQTPLPQIEPQVYQPPQSVKVTSVPTPTPPPPIR
jgi:hypothetical protein